MNIINRFRRNPPVKAVRQQSADDDILGYELRADGRVTAIKQGSGMYGAGGAYAFGQYGGDGPLSRNAFGFAAAFTVSTWIYRCVEVRSKAVSRMPWSIVQKDTKQPIPNHALDIALRRNRQNLLRKIERTQIVYGETFIEKARNAHNYTSDLYWLNNLGMAVLIGVGSIYAYQYTAVNGGMPQSFRPEQIGFMKTDNLFDDLRGMSPVEVVLDEVAIDKDVARVVRAFYANDTRVGLLFIPKKDMNPGDSERFMAAFKKNNQGVNKAGKPVLLPSDVSVERAQYPSELDDVQLRESTRRDICAGLGVPLALAGAWDDANYDSVDTQRRSFYEETIIPECEDIQSFINIEIMPAFDDSGKNEFAFDFDSILALTEDQNAKATTITTKLEKGAISLNEARIAMGDKPIPTGNVFYVPSGVIVVKPDLLGEMQPKPSYQPFGNPQVTPYEASSGQVPPPPVEVQQQQAIAQNSTVIDANKPLDADNPPVAAEIAHPEVNGKAAKAETPCYIILSLADNADITSIQNELKLSNPGIEWKSPADFHVTLVYATDAQDKNLTDIKNILPKSINPFTFEAGPVGTFAGKNGKTPIYLIVQSPEALTALQAGMYASFEALGLTLSDYSKPNKWDPHITLGYAPDGVDIPLYEGVIKVTSEVAICSVESGSGFENIYVTRTKSTGVNVLSVSLDPVLDELYAWERKAKGKGVIKALDFVANETPDRIAGYVREWLNFGKPYKDVFSEARRIVAAKGYDDTAAAFARVLTNTINAGLSDLVTRRSFGAVMRAQLKQYGTEAYLAGLTEGGERTELEDLDRAQIDHWLISNMEYVSAFAAEVYGQGIPADQIPARAAMWTNKSLREVYQEGLIQSSRKKRFKWVYGDTDHCPDCERLNGQVHQYREWYARNYLPGSSKLSCGGYKCECSLIQTEEPSEGRF